MSEGFKTTALAAVAAAGIAGCATRAPPDPQEAFINRIAALCGQAFAGRLVSNDPADAHMVGKPLVMHFARYTPDEIRIPFHIGDDRSRTTILTRTPAGLALKHDHRRPDGSPDAVTMYGGRSIGPGSSSRQQFVPDAETIALFTERGLHGAVRSVWTLEATERTFAYELRRRPPDTRHLRIEFDLTRPVPPPPAAWGSAARA